MLRSIDQLTGYKVSATDGEIGRVADLLIDDQDWSVRYLVIDTGGWLPGRKVVVPPKTVGSPDWESQRFPLELTKEAIENSPEISEKEPVSRQHEVAVHQHFGWQPYWGKDTLTPAEATPSGLPEQHTASRGSRTDMAEEGEGDPHLRSANEMIRYVIEARDDKIGQVADFLVDDKDWVVRHVVVDTQKFLKNRTVLLAMPWIDRVNWGDKAVHVELTREGVENAPEFDANAPVNRQNEEKLYDYYGRPKYWKK